MADNVELNPGTGGAIIATDEITDGGVANGAVAQRIKPGFGPDGSYTDVKKTTPLPIDYSPDSPQIVSQIEVDLSPGISADLDSNQINAGKTGKLVELIVASSVFVKAEIKTVLNDIETSQAYLILAPGSPPWRLPSRDFVSVAQDAGVGFDGFRITVTNLDPADAANVYATILYDEV